MKAISKPLENSRAIPKLVSQLDPQNRKRLLRYRSKQVCLLINPNQKFKLEVTKAS